MYHILTLNKIAQCGLEKFDSSKYTCGDAVSNPAAVLVRSASMHDMPLPESLLAIARAGAGVNNIPLEQCSDAGICVFNTPGANANAVKELVICGLFLASRKVGQALEWCQGLKGEGDQVGKLVEKGKSAFAGPEVAGKTLGLVGLGAIGILVANAAVDLGMQVVGYDPYLSVTAALELNPHITVVETLDALYEQADYLSLHLPLNNDTRGMLNSESFANMKQGMRILNFARADLVDSTALLAALQSGAVAAYVTDFPTDEQIGVAGITAIPHLGASTPESEDNCAKMAAAELIDYLEYGIIKNSVNLPAVTAGKSFTNRVCVIFKDAPDVQANITAALGACQSLNAAVKKGMGYLLADLAAPADLAAIQAVAGVVKARQL